VSGAEPALARAVVDGSTRRQAQLDAAFERFFHEGHPLIVRFLEGQTCDHAVVQDAAQEAFIIARAKWATISVRPALLWVRWRSTS
jgi:DNA-directed RNA polymerase specialized sigma24 family protein